MTRYALHDQVSDQLIILSSRSVAVRMAEAGYRIYELVPAWGSDAHEDVAERRDAVGAEINREPWERRPWPNRSY